MREASTLTNTQQAAEEFACGASLIAFRTHEASQGQDLNLDGDTSDDVLQVYDTATHILHNTHQPVTPCRLVNEIWFCCNAPMAVPSRRGICRQAWGACSLAGNRFFPAGNERWLCGNERHGTAGSRGGKNRLQMSWFRDIQSSMSGRGGDAFHAHGAEALGMLRKVFGNEFSPFVGGK